MSNRRRGRTETISEIFNIYNERRGRERERDENTIKRREDRSRSRERPQSPDGVRDIENILNFVEKYRAKLKKFSETITTRQDTTKILKLIEEKNIAPNLEPEWILNYALKIVEDPEYKLHLEKKLQEI